MGRPREFDTDQALARAMDVFWAKGYDAASLADLLDAMGIARGSLYKAFKDKHSIYLAALDLYGRTAVAGAVALLTDPGGGDGAARIRRVFHGAIEAVAKQGDRRGCFLCNAAVDLASADPEVRATVAALLRRQERAFAAALKDSSSAAPWPAKRRAATARALLGAYLGLRVLARSGYPPAELTAIVTTTLAGFGLAKEHAG